jgi:hypothetical protein
MEMTLSASESDLSKIQVRKIEKICIPSSISKGQLLLKKNAQNVLFMLYFITFEKLFEKGS